MMALLSEIWATIDTALGLSLESRDLDIWRMSLRAALVFFTAIALVRIGNKRFMGRHTTLDVMLGIVFGSVVSRAITGNAPFFPTLAACVVLVGLHWTMSALAFRSQYVGRVFKGRPRRLVNNGELDWEELRRAHITENELKEAVRLHGRDWNLADISSAYLERDGEISIIFREPKKGPLQARKVGD